MPGRISIAAESAFRQTASQEHTSLQRVKVTAAIARFAHGERRVPFLSPGEILELQRQRIHEVVRHAYDTVPFYRSAMDELRIGVQDIRTADDLAVLPIVDGRDLARDPMRFVSHPFRKHGREVFNTSGSSGGVRKSIFWDHASLLLRLARAERDRWVTTMLADERWTATMTREFIIDERRRMLARLLGATLEGHQRLQILPLSFASRTQRVISSEGTVIPKRPLHYHLLSPFAPLEVAAAQITALRPRIVWSFGSYADQFFRFIDSCGAELPLPRVWVYIGDMLSLTARRIAEERGCRMYSVYGAREAGTIGFQCEQRGEGFHLNIDLCAFRLVDARGRDVSPGEAGDVVISVLDNRAMPLLNYRLGDRAVLSERPCQCGRSLPLLARLEGRQSEVVRLGDGRELSSMALESLFGSELRRTLAAQVRQPEPGTLRWTLIPARGIDPEALRSAMVEHARRVLGEHTSMEILFDDAIPRTPLGKFVRITTTAEEQDNGVN